jgi:transcriptional regulator with XRE-family HTH domain
MPQPNGPAIRQLRQAAGITMGELAEKTRVSYQHLANCELGHNTARIEFLYRIANELKVPIDQVVVMPDPPPPQSEPDVTSSALSA